MALEMAPSWATAAWYDIRTDYASILTTITVQERASTAENIVRTKSDNKILSPQDWQLVDSTRCNPSHELECRHGANNAQEG